MSAPGSKGAGEARSQLSALKAADKGHSTVITRYGRAVAAPVPMSGYRGAAEQQSLMPLAGSGRGLWGRDNRRTIRKLRDESSRYSRVRYSRS
jgi:antitoxin (DNA-binding transcriptional repressor) of toxin-antitoxin stability system